jgi:multiple antibiotic resistance protein
MQEYIQATITLLAVINPLICGVMLLQIDDGSTLKHRLFNATKATLAVFVILVLSALLGKYILQIFGISIEVFKIVGGVVIAHIGFGMFGARPHSGEDEQKRKETLSTLIMFAASPGTIATIIALSVVHDAYGLPVIAMVGAGLAVLLTWLVMLVMLLGSGRIHKGGQQIFTRFLGLILISMGLQFVLTGLKVFMTG